MIVAGFGFRATAGKKSLQDALDLALDGHAPLSLATVAEKATAPAFKALASELDLPVVAVDSIELAAQATETQSAASQQTFATGSVAEAAALAAAGPGARLVGPRSISRDRMAACALAIGVTS